MREACLQRPRRERLIELLFDRISVRLLSVVAAVLSIFPEWQQWNRENINDYKEIYIKASLESLKKRDTNGLYLGAEKGTIQNVVGYDIPFIEPPNPDFIIENNSSEAEFMSKIKKLKSNLLFNKTL